MHDSVAYKRQWQRDNADKVNEASRQWRKRNLKKRRAMQRAWRKNNPDKVKALRQREYRQHTDTLKARKAEWRKRYPDKANAATATRRARIYKAPVNDFTAKQWAQLKADHAHRCAYCNRKKPLTQDHVVALSRGGSHTLSNILPACQSCNSSKGTKSVSSFRQPTSNTP